MLQLITFRIVKVTEVSPFLTGIVDDAFALCMACKQSLTSLLTLMGAFREELDYTVLSNLITVQFLSSQFYFASRIIIVKI